MGVTTSSAHKPDPFVMLAARRELRLLLPPELRALADAIELKLFLTPLR